MQSIRMILALALGLGAVVSAGCTGAADADRTDDGTAPSRTAVAPPVAAVASGDTPELNRRGYIPKQLGEEAGVVSEHAQDGPPALTFGLDSVEIDPPCTGGSPPPEGQHTLLLHVWVATGSDRNFAEQAPQLFQPGSFREVGTGGDVTTARPGSCTGQAGTLPATFALNQRYTGTVELTVPQATGRLALPAKGDLINTVGWEWRY